MSDLDEELDRLIEATRQNNLVDLVTGFTKLPTREEKPNWVLTYKGIEYLVELTDPDPSNRPGEMTIRVMGFLKSYTFSEQGRLVKPAPLQLPLLEQDQTVTVRQGSLPGVTYPRLVLSQQQYAMQQVMWFTVQDKPDLAEPWRALIQTAMPEVSTTGPRTA